MGPSDTDFADTYLSSTMKTCSWVQEAKTGDISPTSSVASQNDIIKLANPKTLSLVQEFSTAEIYNLNYKQFCIQICKLQNCH